MTHKPITVLFSCAVLIAAASVAIRGQQTIFNVPSADVLDRGKVYAELDAAFKPNTAQAVGRFSSFVPRVVIGTGRNVEVGLNVTGNVQPGSDTTTLAPAAKWRFYQSDDRKTSLFAGATVFVPIRNRVYRIGSYTYAAAARTFGKTRVTAGAFLFSRSVVASNATRGGGQFAVEQTVNDKFSVAADWLTGRHANGYFTPGAIYKPRPSVTAYFAYSVGNGGARKGNHYFLFELGYNF